MKQKGYADIVLGLQFGDEGKARVIDNLAPNYEIIARFNGGSNAGHTITNEKGSVALHQIPSGIFYPQTTLYIGSGCVVNINKLAEEIKIVTNYGLDLTARLKISSQASIVQPHHILLDEILGKSVGTLKHGIGPAYADRAMRMYGDRLVNIRLADIMDNQKHIFSVIENNLNVIRKQYKLKVSVEKEIESMKKRFAQIKPYVEIDPLYMQRRVEKGARVLFEGAQSVMLDVVKGSVPYVTSSATIAAAAYTGGDLSPKYHRKTIGVAKAIMSRVGYGPFPSEFGGKQSEEYCMETSDDKARHTKDVEAKYKIKELISSPDHFYVGVGLRILSGEYGATSARPRRIGRLDLVQLRYATKLNGVDELIITKCDVLNAYSKIKNDGIPIVAGYKLDGKTIDYVPAASDAFYRVKPIISYEKSFTEDISEIRSFDKLPTALRKHIKLIEKTSGCKVVGLGVGPKREQYISL